jgi:hypothetical protein
MAIIKPNNNTLSSITALPAAITTGKVLQIQKTTTTTELGQTSSSYGSYSGAAVTLTALSANSKFFCILNVRRVFNSSDANNDFQFTDATNTSPYQRFYSGYAGGQAINPGLTGIIYGSHSAGASVTITPQFRTSSGTFTIGDSGGTSTFYVMEIE